MTKGNRNGAREHGRFVVPEPKVERICCECLRDCAAYALRDASGWHCASCLDLHPAVVDGRGQPAVVDGRGRQ